MENLAALSVREVKKAAAEERKRDKYSVSEGQENQIKKQSLSNNLSDNLWRGERSLAGKIGERGTISSVGR